MFIEECKGTEHPCQGDRDRGRGPAIFECSPYRIKKQVLPPCSHLRETDGERQRERQRANGQSSRVIPSEEVNPSPPGFKLCTLLAHIHQTQRTLINTHSAALRGQVATDLGSCMLTPP